ncbi:MAG: glutathione S-transferase family protein [Polyangiaceae bacterium]
MNSPASDTRPLRLYTFTLSHFSEKIRWALTTAGIAFEEVPWTPPFHIFSARRRGKGTTVPILESADGCVQDSTRILLWLEQHRAPFSLLPAAPAEREAALAVEERFDKVGEHVVRFVYSRTLDDAESVVRYWTTDASPGDRRRVKRAFPIARWVFRRKLGMSAERVTRSTAAIEASLGWIEARLASGAGYLAGDRFTVADVTAAALLAPLACPEQHPIYGSARYRAGVGPLVADWQGRPALAWVRDTYERHRGDFPRAAAIRQIVDA